MAGLATDTALPNYATAVPTQVLESLETLAAKPIQVGEEVGAYVAAALSDPSFPAVSSVLATALPSKLRPLLDSDPGAFLAVGLTASVTPSYFSSLPSAVQSELVSFINGGIALEASVLAAPVATAGPNMNTSVVPATGTGAGSSTTSSPIPFVGAASSMKANTVSAVVIFTFGLVLILLEGIGWKKQVVGVEAVYTRSYIPPRISTCKIFCEYVYSLDRPYIQSTLIIQPTSVIKNLHSRVVHSLRY